MPLHSIIISILFHHYNELKQCIREVEDMMMEARIINNDNNTMLIQNEKEEKRGNTTTEVPITPTTTLDIYLIKNTNHNQEISL